MAISRVHFRRHENTQGQRNRAGETETDIVSPDFIFTKIIQFSDKILLLLFKNCQSISRRIPLLFQMEFRTPLGHSLTSPLDRNVTHVLTIKTRKFSPGWCGIIPQTERSPVRLPDAWMADSVPGQGVCRRQPINTSPLSLFLPSLLSKK